MISCIVIEQDVSSFNSITEHLHLMNDMHLLGWYNTLDEGLAFCKREKVDVCFIDADIHPQQGISWVKDFIGTSNVVLTASTPDYALQAFEAGVVDYMLKPVSFARLFFALEKVRRIYFTSNSNLIASPLPNTTSVGGEHLLIKSGNRVVRVKIQDILYVEGLKSYVAFHFKKEKILSLMTMKDAEIKLKPYQFLRIHKSYIINFQHINYIEKGMVMLSDSAGALPIGETYKNAIVESFKS